MGVSRIIHSPTFIHIRGWQINKQLSVEFPLLYILNVKCENQNAILIFFGSEWKDVSVKTLDFRLFVFCAVLPHTGNEGTKHVCTWAILHTCSFSSKSMFCFLSWALAFSSLSSLSDSSDGGGASDSSSCRTWYSTSYACSCLEMSISIAYKPHFIQTVIVREYVTSSFKLFTHIL